MSDLKNYFDFVSQTLGVNSIFFESIAKSAESVNIKIFFAVESFENYNEEEKELLQKMINAVKIPSENYIIGQLQDAQKNSYACVVYFSDRPDSKFISTDSKIEINTYSPRLLLKSPDLKKATWEDLQKVIHFFKKQD